MRKFPNKLQFYIRTLVSISHYFSAALIVRAVPFLLLPLYSKYISPEGYGLIALFTGAVSVVTPIVSLATSNSYNKVFYEISHESRGKYVSSIINFSLLIALMLFAIIYFIRNDIKQYLQLPLHWLCFIPICSFFNVCVNLILSDFVLRKKSGLYGRWQLIQKMLDIILTLSLLFFLLLEWESRAFGFFLSTTIVGLWAIQSFKQSGRYKLLINKSALKNALGFGLPLLPHLFSGIIITFSDRFYIEAMLGLEQLGIYALGYQFGLAFAIITQSVQKVWAPKFYQMYNSDQWNPKKIVMWSYAQMILFLGFALVLGFALEFFLPFVIDKSYDGAGTVILWVMLGYAFLAMTNVIELNFLVKEKTFFLSKISMLAAVANLVLNYFFIQSFGFMGAAYSTLICYVLMFICIFAFSQKISPLPWLYFLKKG